MESFYQNDHTLIYSIVFFYQLWCTYCTSYWVCWDELYFSRIMFPVKSWLKNHLKKFKGFMKALILWSLFLLGLLLLLSLLLFWMQPYALGLLKKMCNRKLLLAGTNKALLLCTVPHETRNLPQKYIVESSCGGALWLHQE